MQCAFLLLGASPLFGLDPQHAHAAGQPSVAAVSNQTAGTAAARLQQSPPRSWVVDAANNEIKAITHQGSYLRYRVHTVDHRGDRVRDTVETKDGSVARLIRKDNRPLTEEEDTAERDRLTGMLNSPSEFARHSKDDVEGKKMAVDLIRLLPDAMNFAYAPGQPQTADATGPEVVIDYSPKPGWNPPTTISSGLRGLRGRAWIDARSRYVVRMEGEIFQTVNFGWGMVARVYPGGTLLLEQRSIQPERNSADERWIFTHFKDDLRVRAVMVKTITVQTDIEASRFQIIPGSPTYQDAIRVLLETPLPKP